RAVAFLLRRVTDGSIPCFPTRRSSDLRKLTRIMLAYSARKNSANALPEYSTMCPATISDSPSTTSNGERLVSATPDTQYTTNSEIGRDTSELQSRENLVCRLLLEKKKK